MIFTLTDRHYNPLDSYETDDYLIGRYIGSILETLDLNISLTSLKAEHWVRGNYIMCRDSTGRGYWFTIYDDEDSLNGDDRALSCYSGTIDIVAEECPPFEETVPRSFGWYFSKVFIDTGIQLGINELSGMTRTLKFESKDATNAEMLQFVLNAFDNAEARLDVTFDGSRPTKLTLNVFKRLGETVPKVLLSDESDSLTDLDRTGSISELGTSLLCYGAQDDNQKEISLIGKYYEEKDSNGNILYVSPKDSPRIFSVKAHEEYYVQLPGKKTGEFDGYINRSYQSEASTQDSLWNEGLAQLKKIDHAIVDYKASGYVEGCDIGDNVQIAAHRMRPAVMVSARLTTFKFNEDDPERNEYEFTNFVDLESNLDDMSDIINKIKDQIVYVIDQSVEYCLDDQGTTAPETGWSNVNPGAVKGKYLWTRTKIDYSNRTSSVSEVATYSAINGEDGRTPFVHSAWAWSADGTDRFTTEYPRENLLKNTFDYASGWSFNNQALAEILEQDETPTKIIKFNYNPNGWVGMYQTYINWPVKPKTGDTVTLSFYAKGNGRIYSTVDGVTGAINVDATDEWQLYNLTGVANKDISNIAISLHNVVTTATSIYVHSVKFEINDEPTIYTPAPSEDYANAYPKYRGEYTDFTEADSTNPDDYTWTVYLGQDGNNGTDGVGIANTKIDYQLHTSATTPPTGTWVTSPPAVTVGKYLWTRTILEYTDGTKSTPAYSVSGGPGANGSDGKDGQDGAPGVDALPIFSGYVTNEAIVLMATNSGAVSDFSKATGTFVTYLGQTKLTTGVTYSRVSQTGVTATINATTGAYSVTAASADTGMVVFKALYKGIELQKIVSVTKAKQGAVGDTGAPGADGATGDTGPQGPPTGIVAQDTVPDAPYVGMLWQNTGDIAGYINPATYRWNGSAWEIYQFTAQNILAETFTGFVFQGVKFIGSEFISNYSITKDSKTFEGSLSIGNGNVLNDYSDSDGVVGKFTIDESGAIINQRMLPTGIGEKYELTPYSLALDGETYRGSINAKELSRLNAVGEMIWSGGWHMSASQTVTPYRSLSSCLTGWLLEFQGFSSNVAQDTDYSYVFVPKSHPVYHSGKPISPAVTVYGGAITRKILYITDTTIKGHANNVASPASGAILTAVYVN